MANLSDKNVVNSLAKGFRVLEAFTSEEPELEQCISLYGIKEPGNLV